MFARKMSKLGAYILCCFMCILLVFQFGLNIAFAQEVDVPKVQKNIYVYDQEKLLTTDQNNNLNTLLRNLEEKTSIEFAVVTTSSFNGIEIDNYAHDLFNSLGLGKSDKDNGILLLVSAYEGHARLEIGYGLEDLLTDSICGRILDKYYVPNRDDSKDADSVIETANGVLAVIGEKYGLDLTGNQKEISKSIQKDELKEFLYLILFIIILLLLRIFIELFIGSGGGGSYRGGGFHSGGFSSGGHFGGGHSGGGGAHR